MHKNSNNMPELNDMLGRISQGCRLFLLKAAFLESYVQPFCQRGRPLLITPSTTSARVRNHKPRLSADEALPLRTQLQTQGCPNCMNCMSAHLLNPHPTLG